MKRLLAALLLAASPAWAQNGTPTFDSVITTGPMTAGGLITGASIKGTTGGTITGFGSAIGQALMFVNNGSGLPNLQITGHTILSNAAPAATDAIDFHFRRQSFFTGGAGLSNNLILTEQIIGAGDASNNTADLVKTTASGTGTAVALYSQANRIAGSGTAWALIGDARDQTGLASSGSGGNSYPVELDLRVNKADDQINADFFGGVGQRSLGGLIFSRFNTADVTPAEVAYGLWIHSNAIGIPGADPHAFIKSAIGFGTNTQIANGLDTRGAIVPAGSANPLSAVTMTAGHIIDFHGGAALTSAPGDYVWYDTATSKLKFNHGATTVWSIDASGNVRTLGTATASVTP